MRVCHIVSSYRPVIGGAERATETLCRALDEQGIDVVILTRRYDAALPRVSRDAGVTIHRLGLPGRGKAKALSFALDALALLAFRLRAYRLIHVQNIDTPMLTGFLARVFLRRRLVATIHGEAPILAARRKRSGRLRLRLMRRLVDRVTTINPANTAVLHEAGYPSARTVSVPNGIDMGTFHPPSPEERESARASLGIPATATVTLYQGRLVAFKRVDLLIDAWSRLPDDPDRVLLIVGQGQTEGALREQAARQRVPARFEGPTDDAARYLKASDVFVLPSGDHGLQEYEGLSVALLEAMSTGVMPLVTVCPGNDVLVPDETVGLRTPIGDAEALAAQLDRALSDADLRRRLGDAAFERVKERYSAAAVAGRMIDVYRSVTPER